MGLPALSVDDIEIAVEHFREALEQGVRAAGGRHGWRHLGARAPTDVRDLQRSLRELLSHAGGEIVVLRQELPIRVARPGRE